MKKNKSTGIYIFALMSMIAGVSALATFWGTEYITAVNEAKMLNEKPKVEIKDLVINTPEKKTAGTVKIKDPDGTVIFEYYGQIYINNNGSDGKPVEVVIEYPFE